MRAPGRMDAEKALSAGMTALGSWYGIATLLLSWLAGAQVLVAERGPAGALVPAPGILVGLAGGLLFRVHRPAPGRPSDRRRLLVVAAGVLLLEAGFLLQLHAFAPGTSTAALALALFKTATLAFAISAGRGFTPLFVAFVLLVVNELVCATVGPAIGMRWAFDTVEAALFAVVVLVTVDVRGSRRQADAPRRALERAVEADALTRTRAIARSRAAAVVHDSVLNDLAMLATTEPGRMADQVTDRLSRTLALLASDNWTGGIPIVSTRARQGSEVEAAVERARRSGLTVQLSGDVAELPDLDPGVEQALGGAVDQCLVNTLRHAGTDTAEVTVLGEADGVTVMVSDDGAGFDAGAVHEDRIGLAASVRARIEDLGGTVRIFAKPGFGTTVLLTVPRTTAPLVGSGA